VANLIEKNDNAINFNTFYMKTINKGVLSMTTILKNKNGLRLNYTDLVEISEQTIHI